ncbi:MAG TPA: ribonuclease Y [Rhodothermales bacterium]
MTPAQMAFVAGFVIALAIGLAIGRFITIRLAKSRVVALADQSRKLLEGAEQKIQSVTNERLRELEAEWTEKTRQFDKESSESRRDLKDIRQKLEKRHEKLSRMSHRMKDREALLHSAADSLELLREELVREQRATEELLTSSRQLEEDSASRHQALVTEEDRVRQLKERLERQTAEYEELNREHVRNLERISGISRTDAERELKDRLLEDARLEAATMIKDIRDQAKLSANREARKVVLTALQRTAAGHTIENTVSVVNLDSDEMKGRIIGREGRNIRAFEAATGVEVIVDDTPEAVILSGFDPVRREIARLSLIKLIQDGRIHPARVEEVVAKVQSELEEEIVETGERTIIDLGLHGLDPELVRLVGRMRYRSSYGQNLLSHSIEVAKLSSIMATELRLDPAKARRAGLLHDIGKVVEGDLESPHAIVGMELCRRHGESDEVCNAVGAHHDEVEMTTPIAPIVQAADSMSGARPGARREALESYIKRLENLEQLAGDFKGVERVYAIQAGRELRVIVNHELVQDAHAEQLASEIAKKIEEEMQYPGQIKVTVIRELRSVSYAR